MKKKYQAPQVEVIILETHNPILNGSVTVSGLSGIEEFQGVSDLDDDAD